MKTLKNWTALFLLVPLTLNAQVVTNIPPEPGADTDGYALLDPLSATDVGGIRALMTPQDFKLATETYKLQQFVPNFDFAKPSLEGPSPSEPWLKGNWNVTNAADAEQVSQAMLAYILEGWFNGKELTKNDTHFRENGVRNWCHTPWLNTTEKGREAIHGLTKEFPIHSSTIYRDVPKEVNVEESAVTWGNSFFNQKVCDAYAKLFDRDTMVQQLADKAPSFFVDQQRPYATDGLVGFKLLFNAMEGWETKMPAWQGAYNWWAHVSPTRTRDNGPKSAFVEPYIGTRKLMNMPLVQIDISLRDKRLKGTMDILNNWIMTSYYYDKNYVNPMLKDKNVPEGFKHMRPFGLQYGLNEGESHLFRGAHNNHRPGDNAKEAEKNPTLSYELAYDKTRLNGPVDNHLSSCLGCHAQAGLNYGLPKGGVDGNALGFMTNERYQYWLGQQVRPGSTGLDFNMQADKAFRNFRKHLNELSKRGKAAR